MELKADGGFKPEFANPWESQCPCLGLASVDWVKKLCDPFISSILFFVSKLLQEYFFLSFFKINFHNLKLILHFLCV